MEPMVTVKKNTCTVGWTRKSLKASIHLPASKSISNRVLLMEAVSGKKFPLKNISEADDTKLLKELLFSGEKILDAENAGTCFRFLTAYLAQKEGDWILSGSERMKERPVGTLVKALRKLGAEIKYLEKEDFPPLAIVGKKLAGNELEIDTSQSSQFISALLLVAPYIHGGLKLKVSGNRASMPYVVMTQRLMKHFGIKIKIAKNSIEVPQQEYIPKDYLVESDWSSAAFWYAMAALSEEAEIHLKGLTTELLQGDSVISDWMEHFNVETHFVKDGAIIIHDKKSGQKKCSINFSQHPDLAPALFVLCSVLGIEATFSGVKNLSIKESSRAEALKTELEKCGAKIIKENDDEYRIAPQPLISSAKVEGKGLLEFETYNDHRLAMAFSMLAIPFGQVQIKNPAVVSKSYPGFWNDLHSAGFEIDFS